MEDPVLEAGFTPEPKIFALRGRSLALADDLRVSTKKF